MKRINQLVIALGIMFGTCVGGMGLAHAQAFPSKPIRIVVPTGAGGPNDLISRMVGDELSKRMKVPVVIENRPGAGGAIATTAVARAAPDGYTLLTSYPGVITVNPVIMKDLPYKPLTDLRPVSLLGSYYLVLAVNDAVPIRSAAQFISYAKANPGKLTYGSSGIGTTSHLAMELLKQQAGIDMLHVPLTSSALSIAEVVSGRIDAVMDHPSGIFPHVDTGKLRALASSGAKVSGLTRSLPTVADAGAKGFDMSGWLVVVAPAATPDAVVQKLAEEFNAITSDPEVSARIVKAGFEPSRVSPDALKAMFVEETDKWGKLVEKARIKQ